MKKKKKARTHAKSRLGRKAIVGGAAAITFLVGVPAFAATPADPNSAQVTSASQFLGQQKAAAAAFGTVERVNGSVITLSHRTASGLANVTITTTSATVYKENGVAGSGTAVAAGDRIVAMGVKDSEGNIANALSVNILTTRASAASTL